MKSNHVALRVPAVMALGGTAIAIVSLIGRGWGAGLSVEIFTLFATIGYYLVGRRDTDVGAAVGGRVDERQSMILSEAAGLSGIAMTTVALVGFVVTTALGKSSWQFGVIACVGGVVFVLGQVWYQSRN
jgi:hypothetical protein